MKVKVNYGDTYMQKLILLMKGIRTEEGEASDFWKESRSLYEQTVVYYAHGLIYPEWVVDTERAYVGVHNEMIGNSFSETFDMYERPDFDPEDIFWDMELEEFLFEGTFIDACRFILDTSLRKWREFGVHAQ